MKKERRETVCFKQILNQHERLPLVFDNEVDMLSKSLDQGLPSFFEWVESNLSPGEQETIRKDLLEVTKRESKERFPKSIIEALYQAAKDYLVKGEYGQSANLFHILTHLFPHSHDIWLGLGLSFQQLNQYLEAIQAFEQAKNLHPQLFHPYLYQAESYFQLNERALCQERCIEANRLMSKGDEKFFKYSESLLKECDIRRRA